MKLIGEYVISEVFINNFLHNNPILIKLKDCFCD